MLELKKKPAVKKPGNKWRWQLVSPILPYRYQRTRHILTDFKEGGSLLTSLEIYPTAESAEQAAINGLNKEPDCVTQGHWRYYGVIEDV